MNQHRGVKPDVQSSTAASVTGASTLRICRQLVGPQGSQVYTCLPACSLASRQGWSHQLRAQRNLQSSSQGAKGIKTKRRRIKFGGRTAPGETKLILDKLNSFVPQHKCASPTVKELATMPGWPQNKLQLRLCISYRLLSNFEFAGVSQHPVPAYW